ncbi:MAG: 50S ribosomal protein L35 [Vampirovibrionales bacterium]|nr:50S ribosomal protein L35 [Vampirovibrionales bacterium]
MPKMKTHKSSRKRFKVTGTGKIMFEKAFRGHLNVKKSSSRKRRLDGLKVISTANENKLSLQLPYLKHAK